MFPGIPLAMFIAFFSITPDTNSAPEIPGQPKASLWKRNVEVFRQTSVRGWQSGKSFFWLGLAWSGTECVIESVRSSPPLHASSESLTYTLFLHFLQFRLAASQTTGTQPLLPLLLASCFHGEEALAL